jgi:hypothetical protein
MFVCALVALVTSSTALAQSEQGTSQTPPGYQPGATPTNPYPQGVPAPAPSSPHQPTDPAAVAERSNSQRAFANQSDAEAWALLRRKFGGVLAGLDRDPLRYFGENTVNDFIGSYAARVDPPGADTSQLVVSSFPLRDPSDDGHVEPVNLDLQRDGNSFVPENPVSDVELPAQASDPVKLSDAGVDIAIDSSQAVGSTAKSEGGNQLFYHEVAPDTDALIAPLSVGAELFAQFRSADSPDRLHFDLGLPGGSEVKADGRGALMISNDSGPTALIRAPAAMDAQGTPVEVRLEATPGGFDLVVPHRDQDLAYPILADPIYENWQSPSWSQGNLNGLSGPPWWASGVSNGGAGYYNTTTALWWNYGWGLYLGAQGGWYYTAGDWGQWAYTAPGRTTYIASANFGPMTFVNPDGWLSNPYMFFGLWSWWNGALGGAYQTRGLTDVGEYYQQAAAPGQINTAVFGMRSDINNTLASWDSKQAYLGGILIALDDPESPTIDVAASPSSSWMKAGSAVVGATPSDAGVGVRSFSLQVPKAAGGIETITPPNWPSCGGAWSTTICPSIVHGPDGVSPVNFTAYTENMPEGSNALSLGATDALGKSATRTFQVKVDRTAPKVTLNDTFDSSGTHYGLTASADDSNGSIPVSGVQNVQVSLDGQQQTISQPDYAAQMRNNSPLLYWRLGEHSGSSAADSSGNSRSGAFVGSPGLGVPGALSSGFDDGAVDLNGTSQYVSSTYSNRPSNIVPNPSFESDTSGWWTWGNSSTPTATRTADSSAPDGANVAVVSANGGQTYQTIATNGWATTAGQAYTGSVWVKAPAGYPMRLQMFESGGQTTTSWTASGGWEQKSVTRTVGSSSADLRVFAQNAPAGAFQFRVDGASVVNLTTGPFVNGTVRTFEGWANRDSSANDGTLFAGSDPTTDPWLKLNAVTNEVRFMPDESGGSSTGVTWSNAWPGNNRWVHWALVFDEAADRASLYINGALVSTQTVTARYSATPGNLQVGARYGSGALAGFFDGKLDEVAVYDHALSADQIRLDYQNAQGPGWSTLWTHDFAAPPTGDYQVTVTATDFAGNTSKPKTFDLDVKPVVHAKLYDGDPAGGGNKLAEEWAQLSTRNSRREDQLGITTRDRVPCDSDPSSRCPELRQLSYPQDGSPPGPSDFGRSVGTTPNDPSVPDAATLLKTAGSWGTEAGSGPIGDVLQPWQTPPSGHGSTYQLLTSTDLNDPDHPWKIWIDTTTRLPLKSEPPSGSAVFYDYDPQDLHAASLPDDFFAVPDQRSQCVTSGRLGQDLFNPAGIAGATDGDSSGVLYTADGFLQLKPSGAASAGSPRVHLSSDGLQIQPNQTDGTQLTWDIDTGPDQTLTQIGANQTLVTADGMPAAVITTNSPATYVRAGQSGTGQTAETPDQIVIDASAQQAASVTIQPSPSEQVTSPCITQQMIDHADAVSLEYWSQPPPPSPPPDIDFEVTGPSVPPGGAAASGLVPFLPLPFPLPEDHCKAKISTPYRASGFGAAYAYGNGQLGCGPSYRIEWFVAGFFLRRETSNGGWDNRRIEPDGCPPGVPCVYPLNLPVHFLPSFCNKTDSNWTWRIAVHVVVQYAGQDAPTLGQKNQDKSLACS